MESQDFLELVVLIITIAGAAFAVWRHGSGQGRKIGKAEGDAELAALKGAVSSLQNQLSAAAEEAKRLTDMLEQAQEDRKAQEKQLIAGFSSSEKLWTKFPAIRPAGFEAAYARSSTKIVTIGNLKGGVAKTTLSINLAAYFADAPRKKRVLIIDLDYQGSATNTLRQYEKSRRRESSVNVVFDRASTTSDFKAACEHLVSLPRVSLLAAGQELDDLENKTMIDWFANQGTFDVRYDLARFLSDPSIRNEYDIILIDTPPRLTTGMINALCASTDLLIPTKLDVTSAEAVGPFWSKVEALTRDLNPHLKLAGVVGTLTRIDGLEEPEQDAIATLRRQVPNVGSEEPLFRRILPYKKAVASEAGTGIAYVADSPVRKIFAAIGDQLAERIGI
jgi:cellulose biosynthesis protein BcsQ